NPGLVFNGSTGVKRTVPPVRGDPFADTFPETATGAAKLGPDSPQPQAASAAQSPRATRRAGPGHKSVAATRTFAAKREKRIADCSGRGSGERRIEIERISGGTRRVRPGNQPHDGMCPDFRGSSSFAPRKHALSRSERRRLRTLPPDECVRQ